MDCFFCDKLGRLDALPREELVWKFSHSVALLGPWQYYEGYCLLVAHRHATELFQLSDEERRGFLDEMCLLAQAIDEVARPRKINYELLGNQVPHLHWHLFPRLDGDPEHDKPVWLALARAESDPAEKARLESGTKPRGEIASSLRIAVEKLMENRK